MDKVRKFIVFNKISKVFCGMLDAYEHDVLPTSNYYLYKEAYLGENDIWDGNYDSGKVVSADSVPFVMLEQSLDQQAQDKIRNTLDYYHQINIIVSVLDGIICGDMDKDALAKYEQFKAFVAETRAINDRYKQAYKDSANHHYISKQEQDEITAKQMEGGVHEIIGPREVKAP